MRSVLIERFNHARLLKVDLSSNKLPPEQLMKDGATVRFVVNRLVYRRARAAVAQGLLSDKDFDKHPAKGIADICLPKGLLGKDFASDAGFLSSHNITPEIYESSFKNFLVREKAVNGLLRDVKSAIMQIQNAEALIFDADNNLWHAKLDFKHIQNLASDFIAAGFTADRPAGKEGIVNALQELKNTHGLGKWEMASFIVGVNGSLQNSVFKAGLEAAGSMSDSTSASFGQMADKLIAAGLTAERTVGEKELAQSLQELYYSCDLKPSNVAAFMIGLSGRLDSRAFESAIKAVESMPSEQFTAFDEVKPALEELRGMQPNGKRMKMCFFSDAPESMGKRRLSNAGLQELFDAYVFSPEYNAVKPDPALFRIAMQAVGVSEPAKAVMIGDSLAKDILGAHQAGMPNILVTRGFKADYQAGQEIGLVKNGIFLIPSIELSDLSVLPQLLRFGK
jgi:HAD superfamily hydrolase (TIGR01549 family)